MTRAPRPVRTDLVDAVVLEVLGYALEGGWLADRALDLVLRRERRLYAAERRVAAEAVYAVLRSAGRLRWLLGATLEPPRQPSSGTGFFGQGGSGRPEAEGGDGAPTVTGPPTRTIRGKPGEPPPALLYALWLAASGAASDDAAARRLGVPPPTIAAALRGATERMAALGDPVERLAVETSLPRWIAERFIAELGGEEARLLALSLAKRAPLTVRANLLRCTRDTLRERLAGEGARARPTPFSPWGLVLDGHANAFALPSFTEGLFEIQDEGSQLVALATGARPGRKVADCCAGAGGKSLALASEMHGKGSLFALDSDEGRLEEARRRARRAGVHNLRARAIPPGAEADAELADLAGSCSAVLVDAPCSGLGTLRRKPDARWRLAPGDPARFAALQKSLVTRFARLVAPGGRLVYATCSIGRAENEDVAAHVVKETGLLPALLSTGLGQEIARALPAEGSSVQLLPHRHGTDGFFIASFERPGS